MDKEKAGALVLAAGVLWGIIGVFSRSLSAAGIDAIQITALRSTVAAAGLFFFLFLRQRQKLRVVWKDLWMFLGTGLCSIALFNIFYFMTMQRADLSVAAVLLYTGPFFVMVLSALLFGERLTGMKIAALFLALFGCVCTTGLINGGSLSPLSILTGVASGFCYGLYSIFGKFALKKYDSMTVTFYTFLVAGIGLLPFARYGTVAAVAAEYPSVIGTVLLLGLVSTLAPFLLYTRGLSAMESGKASVLAFAEPLTATVVGVFYFHEPMTLMSVLGVVLIFLALVLLHAPMPASGRALAAAETRKIR
ncbi:EamA family transporter [Anaerotignum lactatifermentans]|uniref:EamA family transporter n=1 Tax=Anaerotignum lactatifermentans TaxID=160404 RepID=A0ABS2GCM6_9FIRM|nr:DMT family transporter [Anaerotignum lactatifermentans]MBM6829881.1 EamA family transporter [Anaerotignum lactatifermentans]MBM6878383.1 EamA family transporter [Anaerotignum lactatifermentans]MBM6951538.1 EamA family transporter [Anaerotignum lactatifermentans]